MTAGTGDVVVVPAGAVHSFRALGPERLQLVSIHASPRVESRWLRGERTFASQVMFS